MTPLTLHTAYLAPISWYMQLYKAEVAVVNGSENYQKQTVRNHCIIAMPDGPAKLTIPVSCSSHAPIRDVRISDHGNWRHHHWNALQTAYGKSPFFEYYADDFAPLYATKKEYLWDFNLEFMQVIANLLDEPKLVPSLMDTPPIPALHEVPKNADYTESQIDMTFPQYYQVFAQRNGFLPNLSIADLLFNMGPESIFILQHEPKKS